MTTDWRARPWSGVFAATLCAFHEDETIDEDGMQQYIRTLAAVPGVQGLTCNGHTGEIMALRPDERVQVTRCVVDAVGQVPRQVQVVSGVSAEGSLEAIDHAAAAKQAGADAILLMPPHHWLRFGRSTPTAVGFVQDVATAVDLPIVVHQYPDWTKASYSLDELRHIVQIPRVVAVKMGTRNMARWLYDYECLKRTASEVSIITCHDEFLLPTLLEAGDGALIGFAGFAPALMVDLVHAALDGDFPSAKRAEQRVAPLARIIYQFGEPGCEAHQRMKVARWLMGQFPSPYVRRPLRPLDEQQVARIEDDLLRLKIACPNGRRRSRAGRVVENPGSVRG